MAYEKKLRILVDSTSATKGQKEITGAMGKINSAGKQAINTYKELNKVLKGNGSEMSRLIQMQKSYNPFSGLEKAVSTFNKKLNSTNITIKDYSNNTRKATEADREAAKAKGDLERAEAKLATVQDGTLRTMLEKQEAYKKERKAILENITAKTQEERVDEALLKARKKLADTLIAEDARTKALTESAGKHSVAIQEQRRLTEELLRTKQRYQFAQTDEYKQLVRMRAETENINKQIRQQVKDQNAARISVDGLSSAFSSLSVVLGGVATYFSLMGLARISDDYTNLTNRLAAVTNGTEDVTDATRDMLAVSMETRTSMDATMDIYTKMIRVNERLGKSQKEVNDLTIAVSKAVAMSGASTQGAQGAVMQFAQAMSADWATSAQELNSILEQTPALAYFMAKGLREVTGDISITTGTLKKFAEEGGLSARLVFEAMLKVLPDIQEAFGNTDQTISSALQNLRDSFTVTLGEIDKASGVGQDLVGWIKDLAEELPNLQNELIALTAGFSSVLVTVAGGGLVALMGTFAGTVLAVSGAIGVSVAAIAYYIAQRKTFSDTLEEYNDKLKDLTDSAERFNAVIDVMNPQKLRDTIYGESGDSGLVADTAEAFADLAEKQAEVTRLRAEYKSEQESFFWTYVIPTNTKSELEEAITLMEKAESVFDSLVGRYNSAMGKVDSSKLKAANDAVLSFTKSVEGFNPTKQEKAYSDYLKTINKYTEEYTKAYKLSEAVVDVSVREVQQKQLQASMNTLVVEALKKLNEELEKSKSKQKDVSQERLNNIKLLEMEVESLRKGTKTFEEYSTRMEAMNLLDIDPLKFDPNTQKELNKLLEQTIALMEKRDKYTKDNKEADKLAEINTNAEKVLSTYEKQISKMLEGEDALAEFQARQQAVNALGFEGLVLTSKQEQSVEKLSDIILAMQKLQANGGGIGKIFEDMQANADPIFAINKAYDDQIKKIQDAIKFEKELIDLRLKAGDINAVQAEMMKIDLDEIGEKAKKNAEDTKKQDMFSHISTNLTQGVSSFQKFAEITGSGIKEMQVAMDALNLMTAIGAVLNQGLKDPYTAFASMAAMAAAVAQLGYSVGNISGSDPTADRQASQGTGTVLGDASAKSESIQNALDYSNDALDDLVGSNQGILDAMQVLAKAISGASNLISRDVSYEGIASGLGLSSSASMVEQLGSGAGKLFDTLFGGLTGGLFESIGSGLGGMLGGSIFGKSTIVDEGVQILGGTLEEILTTTTAQAFQEVQKRSLFKKSNRTEYRSVTEAVEAQFDLTFKSIFDAVATASAGLGFDQSEISDRMSKFVVESMKISLEGLTGAEVEEELNAVFSSTFDSLTATAIPALREFQKSGEGLGETLTRVATNLQVSQEVLSQLNLQALTGSAIENLRVSERFVELMGGAGNTLSSLTEFVSTFATEERQLEILTGQLTKALGEQDVAILSSHDGVYSYIEALSKSGELDEARLANILSLTGSLDDYFDLVESVKDSQDELNESLNDYRDLQIRLANAVGDTDLATRLTRENELANAVDDTARAYLKAIYNAEDFTTTLTRLNNITSQLSNNTDRVFSAFSTLIDDIINQLETDRDNALNDLDTVYDTDIANLKSGLDIAVLALKDQLDSQLEINNNLKDSLSDTISELNSLVNAVKSAADSLQQQLVSETINRQSAINLLRNFLLTGDTQGVSEAANIAANITSDNYRTAQDFSFEQARTLALLRDVEKQGGIQLSTDQLALKELEDGNALLKKQTDNMITDLENYYNGLMEDRERQFDEDKKAINASYDADIKFYEDSRDFYEKQIDAFRKIDVSFNSFAEALSGLNTSIDKEKSGTSGKNVEDIRELINKLIGSGSWEDNIIKLVQEATSRNVSMQELANALGVSLELVQNTYNNASPTTPTVPDTGSGSGYSLSEIKEAADYIIKMNTINGVTDWDAADYQIGSTAIKNGVSSEQLAKALGSTKEYVLQRADELGLPRFATGLDAGVHTGGWMAVGDKFGLQSPSTELVYAPSGSSVMNRPQFENLINMDGVINELRALRLEVTYLRAEVRAVERNTGETADILDDWDVGGLPETTTSTI